MTGQAAVAVVISIAQLCSAILAMGAKKNIKEGEDTLAVGMGSADTSAAIFFSTSTFIMVCALVAHWYLRRMPVYREVVRSFETQAGNPPEEAEALLPPSAREAHESQPSSPVKVLRVSKSYPKSGFQALRLFFNRRSRGRTFHTTLRSSSISS